MDVLRRHVLGEFFKILGLCLLALLGIYYIIDIFNQIELFIDYPSPLLYKFSYFIYKLPEVLYQVVPIALLISIVLLVGMMARHNELTAVKAGGVSLYRLTTPLVAVALFLSFLIFVNNEYLLPYTNQRAREIKDVNIKGKPERGISRQSRIWYVGEDGTVYNVQIVDPRQQVLEGVTLYRFGPDYQPAERIDAKRARRENGNWVFEEAVRRVFVEGGERLAEVKEEKRLVLPLRERLDDFLKYKKDPDEMNYRELRRYVDKLRVSGFNAVPFQVDLLAKTAIPFISLVVAFVAVSLAVRGSTRGGIVASVGLSMAVGVIYWLVLSVGLSLGHAGRLPPLVAAWGASILFGSIGVYLYAGLRQ